MIKRYTTPEMQKIWSEKRKTELWLKVELEVLLARAKQNDLDKEVYERIRTQAEAIDLDWLISRAAEREVENSHDLLAFVESVQEKLDPDIRGHFHAKMTSYDTEEIPTFVRIRDSLGVLLDAYQKLIDILLDQAEKHKDTLLLGRTHGQAAEVITFGLRLLDWLGAIKRDHEKLIAVGEIISVGKISGAVGTYPDLPPLIEVYVCGRFDLAPISKSTQIIHRDGIATMMNTLAVAASNIEHIDVNFRLMARSDVGELREPFGRKQKGSSRMPHKQNPIKTEQLCGLARVVRGYAMTAMENIPTWEERDISQSAPERIILPDAFNLMHYMVERLTVVIEGMQVFPQRMLENINNTYGTIYSGKVKDLLIGWGVEPEVVYRLIQELSFQAITEKKNLRDLLIEHPVVLEEIKKALDGKDLRLDDCFNPWNSLSRREEIYTRFAVRSF